MNIPEELRYSTDHEWVKVEGETARVGITDYAQDALGDVVFVELPSVGEAYSAGSAFGEIESTKSVSDLFAPVNGTVIEVNQTLGDQPELVNSDPYGEGWICVVQLDGSGVEGLLDAESYRALIEGD